MINPIVMNLLPAKVGSTKSKLVVKKTYYGKSNFEKFSLRHHDPAFHPCPDYWLVPDDHVSFCQHHFMEPDTCHGNVPAP
jgi:hypothetical protein